MMDESRYIFLIASQATNDKQSSPFEGGRGMFLLPVILNEVKNLCSWLTFCYDAILHFVQNDNGGRGRMTGGEGEE